jgi:hypothetical protein
MARDAKQYRVNVYGSRFFDHEDEVIARVRYNQNLDYWDGRNWQNGGVGRHKGITRLKDGRYVVIIGSDWQGERDHAYIVDADEALQEILKAQQLELLDTKKFAELKKRYEEKYLLEDDLEEESLD